MRKLVFVLFYLVKVIFSQVMFQACCVPLSPFEGFVYFLSFALGLACALSLASFIK